MGWSVKLVYMAGVRTGVHVFEIRVKSGIIFKMRNTLFFHVSVLEIYGTSWSTNLINSGDINVLFFNITNLLVQLSIFLIDLFVGTYRLSSHARLEAVLIQTKLNYWLHLVKIAASKSFVQYLPMSPFVHTKLPVSPARLNILTLAPNSLIRVTAYRSTSTHG
jgi:hypothetical protein